jgi:uncharacterized protein (DUF433 family)
MVRPTVTLRTWDNGLMTRDAELGWRDRINIDPGIMGGKPVIKGTRVAIQFIVAALAAGSSVQEVCEDFVITEADVRAALAYASYALEDEVVHALPGG